MTSPTKFTRWTTGTEVAQVFRDQIRGKHGELSLNFVLPWFLIRQIAPILVTSAVRARFYPGNHGPRHEKKARKPWDTRRKEKGEQRNAVI